MVSPSEGNEVREMADKESQCPIVAMKRGNGPCRTPGSEGGAASWTEGCKHAEDTEPRPRVTINHLTMRGTAPRRDEPDASSTGTSGSVGGLGGRPPRSTRSPSLGHGTESSNPDTALRRERQPLGIDRPDLGMLQDLAKVHEMPFRGGSRGTAGASPDANGRLDNRIPRDSLLQSSRMREKLGQMGKICDILPVRERKDCYHVGNERGSVSEQRRLADSRPSVHP